MHYRYFVVQRITSLVALLFEFNFNSTSLSDYVFKIPFLFNKNATTLLKQ